MLSRRLPVHQLKTRARELSLEGGAKAYHLPDWGGLGHPGRIAVIRQLAMMRGRDPRIARLAVQIIKASGALPREYVKQAQALLSWIQDPNNFYYVNEPGERLQDPVYTIRVKHGDCDDAVALLGALFESLGMPWRLVLSGVQNKQKIRYIESREPPPPNVQWTHIYLMVGTPSFSPTTWYFCEPTIRGVPLGWDVVSGDKSYLPEMIVNPQRETVLATPKRAPASFKPAALPPAQKRSPAYAVAYGSPYGNGDSRMASTAGGVAGAAELVDSSKTVDWAKVASAVVTGVAVSVSTALLLDWINGKGMWANSGHLLSRVGKKAEPTLRESVFVSPVVEP